jgi:putative glutamine transport system substrate-binding protein
MKTSRLIPRLILAALFGSVTGGLKAESETLAHIRQRDRLIVGSEMVFPTLNFKDPVTGRNEGFMADLARALAKQLLGDENKVEFRKTDDATRLETVARGDVDLLIDTIPVSAEKLKLADFSDETFRSGSALLVKKGSAIKTIDDIKPGTRVAFVTANPDVKAIREKAPGATYLEFEKSGDAVAALKDGRADVFTQVVTHLFRAASQDTGFAVTGRFTSKPYAIALKKGDRGMQAAVNDFLKSFRASGDYDRLYAKWFAAYGGAAVR